MFFPRRFLKKEDGNKIIQSIRNAEELTSGEIRVHFQRKLKGDLFDQAYHTFKELKMENTEARNGVLIFIVPSKRTFAILGDSGIDAVVPENFWEEIKDDLSYHFKQKKMTDGLCRNIEKIGEKLKTHFPIQEDDKNELPDEISIS